MPYVEVCGALGVPYVEVCGAWAVPYVEVPEALAVRVERWLCPIYHSQCYSHLYIGHVHLYICLCQCMVRAIWRVAENCL